MRMMRCLAVMEIVKRDGTGLPLQAGMEVDFDRVIDEKTGYTIGDAVAGRDECFEPVVVSSAAASSGAAEE